MTYPCESIRDLRDGRVRFHPTAGIVVQFSEDASKSLWCAIVASVSSTLMVKFKKALNNVLEFDKVYDCIFFAFRTIVRYC